MININNKNGLAEIVGKFIYFIQIVKIFNDAGVLNGYWLIFEQLFLHISAKKKSQQ